MPRSKKPIPSDLPTDAQVKQLDMLWPMMESALAEMRDFSKKKPEEVLNPLKVKVLNRLLTDIKKALGEDPSVQYLDALDDALLPENADAVLILGQYKAAMTQFREQYYRYESGTGSHRWFTQEQPGRRDY